MWNTIINSLEQIAGLTYAIFSHGGRRRTWQKTWQRRSAGSRCPYSSCMRHMRQKWAMRCCSVLLWCDGRASTRSHSVASHTSTESSSSHHHNHGLPPYQHEWTHKIIITSASARSISRHIAPVDAQNSAIPGAIPQNRKKPVWDASEPPCKISRRSVKPRLRNPQPYTKKEINGKLSILPYTMYGRITTIIYTFV